MSKSWTDSQKDAINAPHGDILVSAAAGSGKTSVLVERIIKSVVEDGQDITRILALTFTNAAAAEMHDRVLSALSAKLELHPENSHLQKQVALMGQANICTIHAFCQHLLRENFHKLGLSANFSIADDIDKGLLKNQALDEVLESSYMASDNDFLDLVSCYGGKRDDSNLCQAVLSLHNFSMATPFPEQWLKACMSDITLEKFGEYFIKSLELEFLVFSKMYREILTVATREEGFEGYCGPLEKEYVQVTALSKLCRDGDWDKVFNAIHEMQFDTVRRARGSNPETADYIKNIRDRMKTSIKKYMSEVFYGDSRTIKDDLVKVSRHVKALCSLVCDLDTRFSELKRDKNFLDFSDLEHFTIRLLSTDSIEVSGRFDEVFIDEFQDINLAQSEILNKITHNNSFVVGDVKQSIYRFRNAEPKLFLARKTNDGVNSITLSDNFRSDKHILDVINHIFEKIMCREIGEVAYTDSERLYCGSNRDLQNSRVELHVVEKRQQRDADFTDDELQIDAITREAQLTAMRIMQMVEIEKPLVYDRDKDEYRQAEYRDITILASSTKRVARTFASILTEKGIPVCCPDIGSFFSALEISTVLAFLQIIDNPYQDIPLLTVMRSACYQFTDEELATIHAENPHTPFYNAVQTSNLAKCKEFLNSLHQFREYSKTHGIAELTRHILSETNYETYVSTMPNSTLRLANLNLLVERADKFESTSYKSVFEFVQYIKTMQDSDFDYSIANYISQNENAVRIMTIHKSKGLEFPIVFLVDCGKQFNMDDLKNPFLFDFDLGIGAGLIDSERRIKYSTIIKQTIIRKKRAELLSEEMRVLYVALTRAIDRLIIIGSTLDLEDSVARWTECSNCEGDILRLNLSQQHSFLDWISVAISNIDPDRFRFKSMHHLAHEIIRKFNSPEFAPLSELVPHTNSDETIDDATRKEITDRLTYVYPYEAEVQTKLSVSNAVSSVPSLMKPKFLEKSGGISPRTYGIILHFVMQNIDIHDTNSVAAVDAQVARLVSQNMLSMEFARCVSAKKIYDFFSSSIGKRMKESQSVQREVRFFVHISAGEIYSLLNEYKSSGDKLGAIEGLNLLDDSGEKVLLQGVIDCYFEEDDSVVILDYKTGKTISPEYEMQMSLYSKALEKILEKKVKNTYILTI